MLSRLNAWIIKLFAGMILLKLESRQVIVNQRGAGAVEYGLLISVVVVAVVVAAAALKGPLQGFFSDVVGYLTDFLSGSESGDF